MGGLLPIKDNSLYDCPQARYTNVEFTGSVSADSGYRVTEKDGTYTVEEYTPSSGGSGTSDFAVTVEKATNGTVTASASCAAKGTKVKYFRNLDSGASICK